jgi:hypothetical protein
LQLTLKATVVRAQFLVTYSGYAVTMCVMRIYSCSSSALARSSTEVALVLVEVVVEAIIVPVLNRLLVVVARLATV